jgi:hypothetical protein
MVLKVYYNRTALKYEVDTTALEQYSLTLEDVEHNYQLASTTVSSLHTHQRNMYLLLFAVAAFLVGFFLALGGIATYVCFLFKQTVYIYLVSWACVAILISLSLIFATVTIRGITRSRASSDYEHCKQIFKSESLINYKSKGCKMDLKFDALAHGLMSYTFRAQYPYIEISKLDGSDQPKQGESTILIPGKRERKKSGKFEDRGRSKSGVSYSRIADK